jgi:hypothetical protein
MCELCIGGVSARNFNKGIYDVRFMTLISRVVCLILKNRYHNDETAILKPDSIKLLVDYYRQICDVI